jgi:hypothetical protein
LVCVFTHKTIAAGWHANTANTAIIARRQVRTHAQQARPIADLSNNMLFSKNIQGSSPAIRHGPARKNAHFCKKTLAHLRGLWLNAHLFAATQTATQRWAVSLSW